MSSNGELSATHQPSPAASALLLAGLAFTAFSETGATAAELASHYARGVGLSIVASLLADIRGNLRNLVRADIMAICSLYFLALAEFLVPQPEFDLQVELHEVSPALVGCLLGFAAITVGRHFSPRPPASVSRLMHLEPPQRVIVGLFALCFFGGFAHMLVAVDFNINQLLHYFTTPRFTQPWGRGRFGDWRALLYETGMLLYLVPPIAGIVLGARDRFSRVQLASVAAGLLFTLYYGFTSGTRNIFATYLVTFLVAYAFATGRKRRREVLVLVALGAAAMVYATTAMLEFRNIGFANYWKGVREAESGERRAFFVDNNLYVISRLMEVFPEKHEYLGMEIPFLAIVRPIPRALWPGKPEGMTVSIEQALEADEGFTLAATFVGEAYISGGNLGIVLCGLAFGMIAHWWNRLGRDDNTTFGFLIYASGFFAVVMSMRSMLVFTTAILPTIAALIFGYWIIRAGLNMRRNKAHPTPDA